MFIFTKKRFLFMLFSLFALLVGSVFIISNFYKTTKNTCVEDNLNISTLLENNSTVMDNPSSIDFKERQNQLNDIYKSKEKIAYLTFDDGPTKIATPKILDILKKYDIKATFFVIGYRVKEFPDILKRAYKEGHFIANHGFSHQNSKLYQSKNSFVSEILATDKIIGDSIGIEDYHSYLFRFPNGSKSNFYGSKKAKSKEYLEEINYCYIDWNSLNSDSLKRYSSLQLVNNLKNSIKNKNSIVILMHDTSDVSKSYTALEDSILFLKEQGYRFESLDYKKD